MDFIQQPNSLLPKPEETKALCKFVYDIFWSIGIEIDITVLRKFEIDDSGNIRVFHLIKIINSKDDTVSYVVIETVTQNNFARIWSVDVQDLLMKDDVMIDVVESFLEFMLDHYNIEDDIERRKKNETFTQFILDVVIPNSDRS